MKREFKKYYIMLDFVRIISCIMVLLYHLNILKGGYLAVCTFFVLSGYLECILALKNEKFSIKKYYINRFKKIYIPLLIIVFLTIIICNITNLNWLNLKQETTSVIFGYNNFWQLSAKLDYFANHNNSPFMHLWYISILIQFDLIFPIVFKILKKIDEKINKNIMTIFMFLLLVGSTILFYYLSITKNIMFVYYNTIARSFSIIFGIYFALLQHKYELPQIFKRFNKIIFIIYIILLIVLCINVSSTNNYALYMILTTIISVRLIKYSTMESNKRNKVIDFISKSTYEIYLVQYPVIFFLQSIKIENNLKLVIIISITIALSLIIHYIIDKKFKNRLLKFIKIIVLSSIIIYGSFILINSKDNTKEMKLLEEKLNENSKLIEQRNNEYKNNLDEENKKWEEILSSMDDEESKIASMVTNLPVMGIGDSVMLGAINALYKKFPNGYFDGKVSRSMIGGQSLISELKNNGKLGDILILALANNTTYYDRNVDNLMNIIGNREVYWVTAAGADDPTFNERFENYSKKYPNVHIVKWDKLAKEHPEYLYVDGVHPKGDGISAYAQLVYDSIYKNYLDEYKKKKEEKIKEHENELKTKITFYGNNILINGFDYVYSKFDKASFNTDKEYNFNKLYKEIKEKIENKTLEYKIVFIFDSDANINNDNYQKLVDLCKDYEVYICNVTNKKINIKGSNVKIINFYNEINKNEEYLLSDKVHLSKKGNKALASFLYKNIK